MPVNDPTHLEAQIDWKFTVENQYHGARYGIYGSFYYKQFLPRGMVLSILHPPRKIPKQLYERAKARIVT